MSCELLVLIGLSAVFGPRFSRTFVIFRADWGTSSNWSEKIQFNQRNAHPSFEHTASIPTFAHWKLLALDMSKRSLSRSCAPSPGRTHSQLWTVVDRLTLVRCVEHVIGFVFVRIERCPGFHIATRQSFHSCLDAPCASRHLHIPDKTTDSDNSSVVTTRFAFLQTNLYTTMEKSHCRLPLAEQISLSVVRSWSSVGPLMLMPEIPRIA